ncbi:MAG: hypothetical protein KIT72_11850 [Polyangiaceae bacterium]|nr:hypothetical protein [Polyangiaceae bacterium]
MALVGCGNQPTGGERAPSPSAVTEAAPKALGVKAASQLPLDAGGVGRPVDPPDLTPEIPQGEQLDDGGVSL